MFERKNGLYLPNHQLVFANVIKAELVRAGRVIQRVSGPNGVTVVGKNHMLDVVFGNTAPVTQVDPWYIGLINNSPVPVLSENDTLASHAGWSEFVTYGTGTVNDDRKAWVDANASAKAKGTTTAATFTFNASGVVYGAFICGAATGTSAVLWATGAFDATVTVESSDVLNVTYAVSLP